ncbi:unnamed protein product [Strongylus vulgaris]|uniref:Uncharacterized protein n=1 Tax=Strongylus vulgaris TaxID=40348 RepID=A0A3P7JNM2_STRVU|nr:unnamed protein product [Strongylus vulgaris]
MEQNLRSLESRLDKMRGAVDSRGENNIIIVVIFSRQRMATVLRKFITPIAIVW